MASSGQVVTYGELDATANQLSHVFADHGLRPGDHVAFCLENHPDYLTIAWGAHYAGLVYTAISSRLTAEETAYILSDCGAKAFITSLAKRDLAEGLRDLMPEVTLRLMVDGTVDGYDSFEDTVASRSPEPLPDRVDGQDMLYSSGTTGRPKGVALGFQGPALGTPTSLVLMCQAMYGMDADTVYLSPAPLYLAAPLRFCMCIHRFGGTVVVMEHFDPAQALDLIERYRVTHSQWVPTMFIRMLKLPDEVRAKADVSSMKVAIHAAAPCPVEVKRRIIEWWGPILFEYYAGTEGNGFCSITSEEWLEHPGSVGRPLLGEVHICDDDGAELPSGEAGTIFFGGSTSFEYHNDPAKTASSRHPQHPDWSTLGDVGYVDDDGWLFLTDRKAYMIISGGVNIYPQEAENVLALHPKVADVAVLGVPDDEMGEAVKAVVQPAVWSEAGPALEEELIAYCRDHLAHYKCPRSVDFDDALPRHPTGKLYKRLLKDRYWATAP
jgi:acyl-CoA synthetase (AMP-forming)/AMP-acid ligase II